MNWQQGRTIFYIFPVLVLLLCSTGFTANPVNIRVSFDVNGNGGNIWSNDPVISADGRYTAFESEASNLVAGDINGISDIFIHDRMTGKITRVSVDSNGNEGIADSWGRGSERPSISADGRFVAFDSGSNNLIPDDTNDNLDVFVHDRETGQTIRVSVDSNGNQGNSSSSSPSISADGRYVAFQSQSSNLVAGDTNNSGDVFVHDLQTGKTSRVSVDSSGTGGNSYSYAASISADGRFVVFWSNASNLVANDTNNDRDVFIHDRENGQTTIVSGGANKNSDGTVLSAPSISANGRYVAFESSATNLVAGDGNGCRDIFVLDRDNSIIIRISVASNGTEGNGWSYLPKISADGRYVAFTSAASNLVTGDNQLYQTDAFIHDRETGQTTMLSVDTNGNAINDGCNGTWVGGISADGRYVAFSSCYGGLVPGGYVPYADIFVRGPLFDFSEITQVRPSEPEIPGVIGSGRKAVVLTHGWNSDVNAWAWDMAEQICNKIGGTRTPFPASGYGDQLTLYCSSVPLDVCSSTAWDVYIYDWRKYAKTGEPYSAWALANYLGGGLGKYLSQKKYEHIHFLAHSAGSMLIDTASKYLQSVTNKPFIHLTFFDAYDPLAKRKNGLEVSSYGKGADWVDNYVDKRQLNIAINDEIDGTQNFMPSAYNVDVTKWDEREEPNPVLHPIDAATFYHAWPNIFYAQQTFAPMSNDLGFQLSLEAGKIFPNPNRKKGQVCTLPKHPEGIPPLAIACESTKTISDLTKTKKPIDYVFGGDLVATQNVTKSESGVTTLAKNTDGTIQSWTFQTGSPVWSKMDLNVKASVNALKFNYEFLSAVGAEGYLTVFVDDNIVGSIDERHVESAGIHASDLMYIGELKPGTHALAVRIDPYTAVQSSVRLSNLNLVYVEREIQDFPWTMFLPAIINKNVK